MTCLNLNNPLNSSLEINHRGTLVVPGVLWPSLELETISKPPHLCVQQNKPLSPTKTTHRSPTKTTFSHVKQNSKRCSRQLPKFWSKEMWPPFIPTLETYGILCVLFLKDEGLFCCTHEGGGFETVSGSRIGKITQEH